MPSIHLFLRVGILLALVVHTWHPDWSFEHEELNVEHDKCMVVAEQAWAHTQVENFDNLNKNHKLPYELSTSCFSEKIEVYKLTHKLDTSCPGVENCKKLNTSYSRLANCSKRGYMGDKGGLENGRPNSRFQGGARWGWVATPIEWLAWVIRTMVEIWLWLLVPMVTKQVWGARGKHKGTHRAQKRQGKMVGGVTVAVWLWMVVAGMMVGGLAFVMAIKAVGLVGLLGGNVGGHLKGVMAQSSSLAAHTVGGMKGGLSGFQPRVSNRVLMGLVLVMQFQGVEGAQGGITGEIGLGPVGAVVWLGSHFNRKRSCQARTRKVRVAELNVGKRTKAFLTEIVGCMEVLDIDILGLVETGLLQKDQGILEMALDPETHQVFQVASSNEGGAKVQGGVALVVSKKNGIAVERIERDEKEGRWIRALVAIGGAEKC